MASRKGTKMSHQTKLDTCTHPKTDILVVEGEEQRLKSGTGEGGPTLQDLMVAIQGICSTLETKIDKLASEVSLLRADLRNLGLRVKATEDSITTLKTTIKELETHVEQLLIIEGAPGKKSKSFKRVL